MSNRIFKVSCNKALGIHVGLYVESIKQVFHNSPGKGEHLSPLGEFSEGKPVTFEEVTSVDYQTTVNRINVALGNRRKYDLLRFNCEDSIYEILEAKPHSPQREVVESIFKAIYVLTAIVVVIVGIGYLAKEA